MAALCVERMPPALIPLPHWCWEYMPSTVAMATHRQEASKSWVPAFSSCHALENWHRSWRLLGSCLSHCSVSITTSSQNQNSWLSFLFFFCFGLGNFGGGGGGARPRGWRRDEVVNLIKLFAQLLISQNDSLSSVCYSSGGHQIVLFCFLECYGAFWYFSGFILFRGQKQKNTSLGNFQ